MPALEPSARRRARPRWLGTASGDCPETSRHLLWSACSLLHVWEAERRDRWFGRASRGLGVPLTVACGLAAFPRSVRCTRAQSAGASQQRASRSEQALERERYTQLREGCRKSRRGRRSTVIDELAAAAARFAAHRAWCRAQQSNPLHPQGWHAWLDVAADVMFIVCGRRVPFNDRSISRYSRPSLPDYYAAIERSR